ncbi:MAG: phosphatidylglycerol lysyltransferase domain-containing protein [Bacteroidota bacterium]|nr:phosphatidylglycerol lysyltransferase domain-containing protein [Bacteroidota bacterium]
MIVFRPVTIDDRDKIQRYTKGKGSRLLNYSFEVLFLWRDVCDFEIAEKDGFLLIKTFHHNRHYFLFPLGEGNLKQIILDLVDYARSRCASFQMFQILPEQKEKIETLFPGCFSFEPTRDEFEYLFESEKLISLQGKALQPKRNHINAFEKQYDWSFEEITLSNMVDALMFSHQWDMEMDVSLDSPLNMEIQASMIAFEAYFCLGLDGGILRANGEVVAISLGCPIAEDTYLVLFEKADNKVRGAYPMINREFARRFCSEFRYINRAEDNGDEGLRKAKLSYHPDVLQEVFRMTLINKSN